MLYNNFYNQNNYKVVQYKKFLLTNQIQMLEHRLL